MRRQIQIKFAEQYLYTTGIGMIFFFDFFVPGISVNFD